MKICVVVGTRPEIIKMFPVIKEIQQRNCELVFVHSGQHYSYEMDRAFVEEFSLPEPDYSLEVGSSSHGNQTGNILIKIEPILEKERPDVVLVQGDTNTVLAAALAASKLQIPIGHVEAGLRSYDRTMPEETNRVVTDQMSEYLFAVSKVQQKILLGEGVSADKIHVVGNTVCDAVLRNLELAELKSNILGELDLKSGEFVLVTAHRASNVDTEGAFRELLQTLQAVSEELQLPLVWPMHPRCKKVYESITDLSVTGLRVIKPVGYLDSLLLQKNSKIILTDSGGIQEEACILGTPCLTLRENTERPETVDVGANILVGRDPDRAVEGCKKLLSEGAQNCENPFGDGRTAGRILDVILGAETLGIVSDDQRRRVCVVGLGYMGLPFASLIARAGHDVFGVDISTERVRQVNLAECPFQERGLPELLRGVVSSGRLNAGEQPVAADIFIVSVPTNKKDNKYDGSHVDAAIESLLPVLADGNIVVIESTIKPGVTVTVQNYLRQKLGKEIHVLHCPERAIPGKTLYELQHNERIVGGLDAQVTEELAVFYETVVDGKVHRTSAGVAECAKLMENTFRDVNIALANEFDSVLFELGVPVKEAIELANRHPRVNIHQPGIGVGGHCIPIDPYFLVEGRESGQLIRLAREINENRPKEVVRRLAEQKFSKISPKPKKIGVLGYAYKPDVDDSRETPASGIIEELTNAGYEVALFDPLCKAPGTITQMSIESLTEWADLLLLTVRHSQFQKINFNLTLCKVISL